MTDSVPVPEAGAHLSGLVQRTREGAEHVFLTEGDDPVATIVSIETFREMQAAQDAADIAMCDRIIARGGPWISQDEILALIAAEDNAGT